MKASETKFQPIIEGTKQYVVPLFQRPYSWDKKQWDVLWNDLIDLCENDEPRNHFIGSIVTMPTTSVPEGVAKYLLIDGQQRLTTIFILLTLLRDLAKSDGNTDLAEEINQTMLVNPFKRGQDYAKLLPTQADREAFQHLILHELPNEQTQVARCYQFFKRKIKSGNVNIKALNKVITTRLSVVSIVLDPDDNPHLVFESLNAKGLTLTQADLIRNYFFMRIHTDEQETIYTKYWQPMQTAMGAGGNLTECIRHFMMRNGDLVKEGEVYFTLKNRVDRGDSGNALAALQEIAKFAAYYQKLIAPEYEIHLGIRRAIQRLNRLEVTTSYPFLLNCYDDYATGRLSADEFIHILQVIENYIVRRFVCNVPTSHLNKMFPQLYSQALKQAPTLLDGVRAALQTRGYPKDNEFRARLVDAKLYGFGERAAKTRLILETLEAAHEHKEQVPFDSQITIEHILPQTLTEWWQTHLGEDWQADHELALHTLGNLTLTAYNTELSNDTFPKKQQRLGQSHFELNRHFQDIARWDRQAIETRSQKLADLALTVWPYFGEHQSTPANEDTVTGRAPTMLTILGDRIPVTSWRDVQISTFNTIAELEPELFDKLAQESHFISTDATKFRRSKPLVNGYHIYVSYSAKDIYRFCLQAMETIGLTKDDWVVELA